MDLTFETYTPKYASDFENLNLEWLEEYFVVEEYDKKVLSRPEEYIIDKGGHILFALMDGSVAGTVALLKINDNTFELTKMAVAKGNRGKRIGQRLMEHCIAFARANHIEVLILYSSTKLTNAIHIYRKYGFKEVALEKGNPYHRSDIKMELAL